MLRYLNVNMYNAVKKSKCKYNSVEKYQMYYRWSFNFDSITIFYMKEKKIRDVFEIT